VGFPTLLFESNTLNHSDTSPWLIVRVSQAAFLSRRVLLPRFCCHGHRREDLSSDLTQMLCFSRAALKPLGHLFEPRYIWPKSSLRLFGLPSNVGQHRLGAGRLCWLIPPVDTQLLKPGQL
jgi:hypothetical protein